MLVPWTEQESRERVFLLQQLKPTFPLNLMPQSSPASPIQCYTASFVMVLPSLSLCSAKPAGTEGNSPGHLWDPQLGFCSSELPTRAVGWLLDALAQPWWTMTTFTLLIEHKKGVIKPLDFNQTCGCESVWWQSLKSSCITPTEKMWLVWMLMKFKCHESTVTEIAKCSEQSRSSKAFEYLVPWKQQHPRS